MEGFSGGKSCTCVVPALGSSGKHRILQQPLIVSSELSALGGVTCILSAFVSNQESPFLEGRATVQDVIVRIGEGKAASSMTLGAFRRSKKSTMTFLVQHN